MTPRHLSHARRHERRRPPGAAVRRPAARRRRARPGRAGPAGARAHRARLRAHAQPASSTPRRISGRSRRSSRRSPRRTSGRCRSRGRPASGMVGVCRHFTLLHVAMLRAQGVAARARCGFGAYFEKGKFVDHWVTEYWNESAEALGAGRCRSSTPASASSSRSTFDPLDVPRDQFLVAGDAWQLCRAGKADPDQLRHPRHARPVVHRRQRHPRRGRPQQPRDAAVGRVGRHGPQRCRARPAPSSIAWPSSRTRPTSISTSCAPSTRTSASPFPARCSTPCSTVPNPS